MSHPEALAILQDMPKVALNLQTPEHVNQYIRFATQTFKDQPCKYFLLTKAYHEAVNALTRRKWQLIRGVAA